MAGGCLEQGGAGVIGRLPPQYTLVACIGVYIRVKRSYFGKRRALARRQAQGKRSFVYIYKREEARENKLYITITITI